MAALNQTTPHDDHAVLQRFFASGGSIRMLADVERRDLDTLYAYATQLLDAGELHAARNFLLMLARVDHWNFDYWFALGLCQQRLASHDEAIFCFSRAGMIRVDDPRASYHAGVSYRLAGNSDYAAKAFRAALGWCGERGEHSELKARAARQLAQCAQCEREE
ncbi:MULTISPECIES: SycD/LcrH family type III secretion system chaperone [Burkholderia]|uniref:SycD/LcrH family type III secretion system chaperone n=1 Tax=Burkholderia TaxID=32008 RepID=UPI0005311F47|nr:MULTISPECIES: SycD/LcrH family type III secretion system chaperone [Burkholderia]AOJ71475.1 type III secretion protein [Burkholderia savannae]AOJ83899.1 type III secretion protein [Burkholderia savannae]AOK49868.1 type III secretion protein [Burkholderia sp. MSMB617WGS]KGR93317.1 type III secretion low calcium response chaperone LcrH/SycD [Burkholderia sp. ABCPW 111]KVG37134.1 type III secretion protein [Burkholderia sp. MSMB0265]